MPRYRRTSLGVQILLRLLLICALVATSRQQETIRSWDKLAQLIPTNSVYEKPDHNAPLSKEANAQLDDNKVITKSSAGEHESKEVKATYEEYEDGESKPEEIEETEDSSVSRKKERSSDEEDDPSPKVETEDTSKDDDYLDDLSRNQYDNAYYYYDDYENENRSRYEAVDDENYSDFEDESILPEAPVLESKHDQAKKNEGVSNASTTPVPRKGHKEASNKTSDTERGSSMQGSDTAFVFVDLAESDSSSDNSSILIGGAVVSVVTTKSVVNGTISVPTSSPTSTTEQVMPPPAAAVETTTEDSSRILASVQTSRSVSGARFLPFPVVDHVEHDVGSSRTSQLAVSTESIIDKLDWAQSRLSGDLLPAAILAGGFKGNNLQLDVLGERDQGKLTTTARTPVTGRFVPRRYSTRKPDYFSTTTVKSTGSEDVAEDLHGSDGTTPEASRINVRWPSVRTATSTEAIATTAAKPKTSFVVQDIGAFLPAGYKLKKEATVVTESSVLSDILARSKVDISSLLPLDYKRTAEDDGGSTTTTTTVRIANEKIASSIQDLFASSKFDITDLLPKDYDQKKQLIPHGEQNRDSGTTTIATSTVSDSPTTRRHDGPKIVFPSRPGGRKSIQKITTPQTSRGDGPGAVTPKIQKGWPTRATTEFTGWPTPSTTPISIEKLLEAARTATVASTNVSLIPSTNEISSTSSTSTTTTTQRPTTPGVCDDECEVAGTIRIVGNATWVPELFDRNTHEWQKLANEVEREVNFIFSRSTVLTNWYKSIRIDSFSQGSVLVDYFVELANLQQKVNTQELKVIFHDSLRTYNANRWNETSTKGALRMGIFTIDPKYTDFVVIPKTNTPQYMEKDDKLIPQWVIAVIVIGVGGLLFIIVFGVSVLVNRQNGSKLKPTVSGIYEEEIAKHTQSHRSSDYSKPVHTIWTDPDVSWNDKSFESTSNKILVDKLYQDNKKYNLYDSWRSEWCSYYYNPSHASSKYGSYDSTTNLSNRHHPDYDTNF